MPPTRSPRPHEHRHPVLVGALSWALALLGLLCLTLNAWALAIGARPLAIRTGSMAPSMPVGTVAVVKPESATRFEVGDVVAIERNDGRRIMHRVRRARAAGGGSMTLVLRGDRNRAADPPVTVRRVERLVLVVPAAGRPLTWLSGRWAQYWLGVATGVLALLWVSLRQRRALAGVAPAASRRRPLRA